MNLTEGLVTSKKALKFLITQPRRITEPNITPKWTLPKSKCLASAKVKLKIIIFMELSKRMAHKHPGQMPTIILTGLLKALDSKEYLLV